MDLCSVDVCASRLKFASLHGNLLHDGLAVRDTSAYYIGKRPNLRWAQKRDTLHQGSADLGAWAAGPARYICEGLHFFLLNGHFFSLVRISPYLWFLVIQKPQFLLLTST